MPTEYKVLGQVAPSSNSMTTLYTVPAATQAVVSSLTVCNRSQSAKSFKIAVRPDGAVLANQHYIAFDTAVAAVDTVTLTIGMTLGADDVVSVASFDAHNCSFTLFGSEVT
jgi:hypothetical protein